MKRFTAIILVFSIIFLFGCKRQTQSNQPSVPSESTNQGTTETTQTGNDIQPTQKPMYAISLPFQVKPAKAEDGTVIFNCVYQNISLVLPEAEVADKVIVDFLNRTDKVTQYAETAFATAKQAYSAQSLWTPHLLQMLYSPTRFDSSVLSLYGSKVSYSGGAHAGYSGAAVNYDLLTGDPLRLTDIIRKDVPADTLSQLVINTLSANQKKDNLFPTFDATVKQLLGSTYSNYQNWYFNQTGLCFFFDPYEIAPFSSGTIIAKIPYSQLTGILKDAYFPAEEEPAHGTLKADLFTEETAKEFTQFSELILSENSTKILLHTDKSVYDIRITASAPVTDTSSLLPSTTVFAAYTLTPGDAIMVEANLNETVLQISCRTGDKIHQHTVSIQDDKILLTEN